MLVCRMTKMGERCGMLMQCNAKQCNNITNNAPQGGPKLVRQCPHWHQMAPSWPQHGARTTQFEFTVTRIRVYSCTNPCLHPPWAPKWIKDLPNRRQDGAKHAQVGPKLAENGPKMAPVGSILGPNLQNLIRRWSKVASSGSQYCMKADFLKLIRKAMKTMIFHVFSA